MENSRKAVKKRTNAVVDKAMSDAILLGIAMYYHNARSPSLRYAYEQTIKDMSPGYYDEEGVKKLLVNEVDTITFAQFRYVYEQERKLSGQALEAFRSSCEVHRGKPR